MMLVLVVTGACPPQREGRPTPCVFVAGAETEQALDVIAPSIRLEAGTGARFECPESCVHEPVGGCELVVTNQGVNSTGEVLILNDQPVALEVRFIIVESDGGVLDGALGDGGSLPTDLSPLFVEPDMGNAPGRAVLTLAIDDEVPGTKGRVVIVSDAANIPADTDEASFSVRLDDL